MDWLRRRARDWYQRALKGQLPSDWEEIQSSLATIAVWTVKFWAAVFIGVSWCVGLMCAAVVTYVMFYHYMIPNAHAEIPVQFDFAPDSGVPTAIVHLQGDRQWRYTQGEEPEEFAEEVKSRYFAAGHYYNAYLDLSFPDSSSNHDCGMVTIDMRALSDRTTLASALHSFLPQYTSPLVRWMWSWTFALPLVTGLIREQQSITLPMFDQLAEQEQRPISTFEIKIKTSKQHEFHLYKATLRLQVQLFGLRYLMYHWSLSTGVLITLAIFSVELFWSAVLLLLLCLIFCGGGGADDDDSIASDEEEAPPADDPSEVDPFIIGESQAYDWQNDASYDQDDDDEYEAELAYENMIRERREQEDGGSVVSSGQSVRRRVGSTRNTAPSAQPRSRSYGSYPRAPPLTTANLRTTARDSAFTSIAATTIEGAQPTVTSADAGTTGRRSSRGSSVSSIDTVPASTRSAASASFAATRAASSSRPSTPSRVRTPGAVVTPSRSRAASRASPTPDARATVAEDDANALLSESAAAPVAQAEGIRQADPHAERAESHSDSDTYVQCPAGSASGDSTPEGISSDSASDDRAHADEVDATTQQRSRR